MFIIIALLEELAKVRPQTWCKISIWLEKAEHCKTQKFISHIKMCEDIITFGDIEIGKLKFYCYKSPIF